VMISMLPDKASPSLSAGVGGVTNISTRPLKVAVSALT
jgi:hypothetical protein